MTPEQRLSNFLADLYRAAAEPGGWQALALPFARLFEAESSLVLTQPGLTHGPVLSFTENFTPKHRSYYQDYYIALDPWRNLVAEAGPGKPVIARDSIPDAQFLNTEVYVDWLKPIQIFQFLGCAETGGSGLVTGAVHRPRSAKDFDQGDKDRLRLVASHYAQAVAVAARFDSLRSTRRVAFAALDTFDTGIVVVAAEGKILYANTIAEEYFRLGSPITAANGFLQASDTHKAEILSQAIRLAVMTGIGSAQDAQARIALDASAGRLILCVCPLPPGSFIKEPSLPPCAIVFIDRANRRIPGNDRLLARLYGLSAAEARLALALAEGIELKRYADTAAISYYTARAQLRSIFEKTGHSRQSDLIRDILSNPFLRLMGRADER